MQATTAQMLIDGEATEAASGEWIDVDNPADSSLVGRVPKGGVADAEAALGAAARAFSAWAGTPAATRAKLLVTAANLVQERRERLATLLTAEQGKPLPDARKEIDGAAETLRFYAEEAKRIGGEIAPPNAPNARSFVIRQPAGVVVAIVPWNYPVSLLAWKVAPALAAGCTVVAKPPSETPLATLAFIQALHDAGLPDGVLNAVTGPSAEVGHALIRSPLAQVVAFTGSTETGIDIYREAAPTLKKLNLELGGQTALVVFADSNLGRAIADGVKRSFRNAGQICNGVNRILVHESVAAEYTNRFVRAAEGLRIGGGFDEPAPDLGPMLNDAGLERAQRHVDDAVRRGAALAYGGRRLLDEPFAVGRFYPPTILTDTTGEMLVMREETFGPVVGIATFHDVDEAIAAANATPFGLVTYVYTTNVNTIFRVAEGIDSGSIAVNNVSPDSLFAPYGGWKQSGLGVELSTHGLEEFQRLKHIRIELEA
ncbi:MAG: Betaine-aldehyde dehydrogenase [Thermomicrobiales bacterium]|jgi:acyl-CoA reductase-like NAD-dependent aldehyde dehydrogenase|nr:Betaine-aldehyde dehydrogenase [Thermomicrobiales bacterium]